MKCPICKKEIGAWPELEDHLLEVERMAVREVEELFIRLKEAEG